MNANVNDSVTFNILVDGNIETMYIRFIRTYTVYLVNVRYEHEHV